MISQPPGISPRRRRRTTDQETARAVAHVALCETADRIAKLPLLVAEFEVHWLRILPTAGFSWPDVTVRLIGNAPAGSIQPRQLFSMTFLAARLQETLQAW